MPRSRTSSQDPANPAPIPHTILVLVLGFLAFVALIGVILVTIAKDNPSAQALVFIVTTIVAALTTCLVKSKA